MLGRNDLSQILSWMLVEALTEGAAKVSTVCSNVYFSSSVQKHRTALATSISLENCSLLLHSTLQSGLRTEQTEIFLKSRSIFYACQKIFFNWGCNSDRGSLVADLVTHIHKSLTFHLEVKRPYL